MTRSAEFSSGLAILSSTLLLAFTMGCNGSSHPGTINPTTPSGGSVSVSTVQPATGATGVATNGIIQVTFSSAVTASTVDASNIVVTDPSSNKIAGAVTYNSTTNVATFTPSAVLATSTKYTVTVTGVTGSGGAAMSSSFTSTFTTAGPQYQSTFFGNSGYVGQIAMDSAGNTTIELTGATASTTYTLQFCPAQPAVEDNPIVCMNVGTVATSSTGSANTAILFPQPGSWAGDFQLNTGNTEVYYTTIEPASAKTSEAYMATLLQETKVNGKGVVTATQQNPLTGGTVTFSDSSNSLQFVVNGATPNAVYNSVETTDYLGSSSSYGLYNSQDQGAFTTDAQGNVTFTVLQDNDAGDLFTVTQQQGYSAGFIGGFVVPNP